MGSRTCSWFLVLGMLGFTHGQIWADADDPILTVVTPANTSPSLGTVRLGQPFLKEVTLTVAGKKDPDLEGATLKLSGIPREVVPLVGLDSRRGRPPSLVKREGTDITVSWEAGPATEVLENLKTLSLSMSANTADKMVGQTWTATLTLNIKKGEDANWSQALILAPREVPSALGGCVSTNLMEKLGQEDWLEHRYIQDTRRFIRNRDKLVRINVASLYYSGHLSGRLIPSCDEGQKPGLMPTQVSVTVTNSPQPPTWEGITPHLLSANGEDWYVATNQGFLEAWARSQGMGINEAASKFPAASEEILYVHTRLERPDDQGQLLVHNLEVVPVSVILYEDAPKWEVALSARPSAYAVTWFSCEEFLANRADPSSMEGVPNRCEGAADNDATESEEGNEDEDNKGKKLYPATGLTAAPISLTARFIPFSAVPNFGLTLGIETGILSSSAPTTRGSDGTTQDEEDQADPTSRATLNSPYPAFSPKDVASSDTSVGVSPLQVSGGLSFRLNKENHAIDLMIYGGVMVDEVDGATTFRPTAGVAIGTSLVELDEVESRAIRKKLAQDKAKTAPKEPTETKTSSPAEPAAAQPRS